MMSTDQRSIFLFSVHFLDSSMWPPIIFPGKQLFLRRFKTPGNPLQLYLSTGALQLYCHIVHYACSLSGHFGTMMGGNCSQN